MNFLLLLADFCSRAQARLHLRSRWPLLLLLVSLSPSNSTMLRAQDTPGDNPTGPSGDYNGEVTTAGSYDPFTRNAKRAVTDLVVPASNGAYPLAFSRIYNSAMYLVGNEPRVLGDGGNWRHSYMWTLATAALSRTAVTAYNVAYPDGGVITFKAGRSNAPANEYSTYWRGPSGTQDRLEVTGNGVCLHKSDGGLIYFSGNMRPTMIVDPYGAVTSLSYNGSFLTQVTEPGGRWLQFGYSTYTETVYDDGDGHTLNYSWTLMTSVNASTGQSVTYTYGNVGGRTQQYQGMNGYNYVVPYKVLTNVTYNSEPKVSGSGNVQANYTYEYNGGGIPVIKNAYDPHYSGAMVGIRYQYTSTGSGLIQEEQNMGSGAKVSNFSLSSNGGVTNGVEIRGDKASNGGADITRAFHYGETTINGSPSNAKASQLTSCTDYEGNLSYLRYYEAGNANGEGNLFSTTDALGHSTSYGHERFTGKVYAMQLPDGRVRHWNWLAKDLSTAQQPYYLYQYTDERGRNTTYHRFPNTGLVSQIDYPDGSNEQFQYTPRSGPNGTYYKIGYQQTKLGAKIYYGYGSNPNNPNNVTADLLTSVTRYYDDGTGTWHSETTSFAYDAYDRLYLTTDPRGVATRTIYNARHQLVQTMHMADNTTTSCYYDDLGNCTDTVDELNHIVHTTYDEYRRPLQVATPINDGTNGNRYQTFAYDPRDYGSNSLSAATSHTRAQWSVSWQTDGKGVERIFSPNGWLKRTYAGIAASGNWMTGTVGVGGGPGFVYDYTNYSSVGQVLSYYDTQGQLSKSAYDDLCGRKTSATDPNGHVSSWTYYTANDNASYQGWLKSVTAPGSDINAGGGTGNVTKTFTGYDQMGRVTATVDPFNHTYNSGYDFSGNLLSQGDGLHNTPYGYDGLGRKVTITNPAATSKQERWTYDASGNVHTYRNYAGNTCTYAYDMRNRCTSRSWDDGTTSPVSYTYDAASRVTDINNWHANVHYTYDDAGEVLAETTTHNDTGASGTTHYARDVDGNVTGISNPGGFAPQYAYDWQGRCTGVYAGNNTFSHYTYSGNWLAGRAMGNGLCTTYNYQANGRCWDVWHRRGDLNCNPVTNGSISRHLYGFEPNGQISWFDREADSGQSGSSLENGNGDAYSYYADGSLYLHYRNLSYAGGWPYQHTNDTGDSQVDIGNPTLTNQTTDTHGNSFHYDAAGNRDAFTCHNTLQATSPAQADNRYSNWTYDNNFNTRTTNSPTNPLNPSAGWTYTYDAENRLTNASGPGGVSATFVYDGLGRLCVQNVNNTFTRFYYAGSQRVEECGYGNNVLEDYMFDAPGSDQILMRQGQYGQLWYQYDLMGNTSHLSAWNGAVVEQYLYDAYGQPSVYDAAGNARPNGSNCDNRYLFKGAAAYEWIAPMATYYARARFYLPYHGRWLQPDPIGQKGGLNIYTYCGNDPVNGADPSGLDFSRGGSAVRILGYGNSNSNTITQGPAPTGSHIPTATFDRGPFQITINAVYGQSITGWSAGIQNSIAHGTFEGIDVHGNAFARATAVNGRTPPIGASATIVFPGFGGGYNTPRFSNYDFHRLVGDGFEADRYNIPMAAYYAQQMMKFGATGINLYGYSLGGAAAIELANTLSPSSISSVVTIDPVLLFGGSLSVGSNVKSANNFFENTGGIVGLIPIPGLFGHFRGTPVSGATSIPMDGSNHLTIPYDVLGIQMSGGL